MQELAREALAQEDAGQHGDEDGADVDEHGGRAGVEAPFGLVERDVVGTEPEQAADEDGRNVAAGGQALAADADERSEDGAAHEQPAERQGTGGQVLPGGADPHEGGGPQYDRHERGAEGERAVALEGAEGRHARDRRAGTLRPTANDRGRRVRR